LALNARQAFFIRSAFLGAREPDRSAELVASEALKRSSIASEDLLLEEHHAERPLKDGLARSSG